MTAAPNPWEGLPVEAVEMWINSGWAFLNSQHLEVRKIVEVERMESMLWELEAAHPHLSHFRDLIGFTRSSHNADMISAALCEIKEYADPLPLHNNWARRQDRHTELARYQSGLFRRFEGLVHAFLTVGNTAVLRPWTNYFGPDLREAQFQRALDYEDTTTDKV